MKKNTVLLLLLIIGLFRANAQEKASFDKAFQKANNGKSRIEIPPLKELLHIMLAITKTGLNNDDMVNQSGTYYQDVLKHFKPYANEPIIKTFDSLLNVSLYNYIFISGNAMSYDFSGAKLKRNPNYIFPARGVANMVIETNPLDTYRKDIEAFANKSRFSNFYSQHKPYYTQIIEDYKSGADLEKQWKWLEKNFKTSINSYLILCSPLINGLNYTTEFKDNGFRQIVMVLPMLDHDPKLSVIQNELFNTRVMFSEIDHNYVSAPSDANKTAIDSVFKKRATWVNEKADGIYAYPNPIKVFNEYMTFGAFLIYCQDNYNKAIYAETRSNVISLMTARGFMKMELFISCLEQARMAAPDNKIDDLYPKLLELLDK
ncbi:DUF4932 domain-containing protein [Pedobacter terrae]|uniref:DUF4932 domain-containing protein n=1 Tax=Pedobacter terrae TaxID=405671 RepID=UPI002FFAEECC